MEDILIIVNNNELSFSEMKEIIKKNDFFEKIIGYINDTIFPNIMIREEEEDVNAIRDLFINEVYNIITNFNKYIGINLGPQTGEIKLPQLVNIDLENKWFAGEISFINDLAENHFAINPLKSQIVSIVCKLVDFTNTYFISKIDLFGKKINYITHNHPHFPLDDLIRQKAECIAKFKDFHTLSNTVHKYFLLIFNKNDKCYLSFLPRSIMNIFSSSLMFIENDKCFLDFIVKMHHWIPSEYRCIYITKIIKLIQKNEFSSIICKFKPDICLLIDDVNTLYKKYLKEKDQDVFQNMILITHLLSNLLSSLLISGKKFDNADNDADKLIYFISVQLTIISKIKSEKEQIPLENYHRFITNGCICIKYIIYHDINVIKSYLAHYIPNILLDFCNDNDNEVITALIHDIFTLLLMNNDKVKIYLCSQDDQSKLSKLSILLGKGTTCNLCEWIQFYENIKKYEFYDELLDPITSCIIVKPCVIPMNQDGSMVQVCDKYMLSSYLWATPINPFTRCELSINELEEFNKLEHCVNAVAEFNIKLKNGIAYAKKIE
jgi:hypothetical protein